MSEKVKEDVIIEAELKAEQETKQEWKPKEEITVDFNKSEKDYFIIIRCIRHLIYICTKYFLIYTTKIKHGFKVKGRENVPKKGGYILCSNHQSIQDPWIVSYSTRRKMRYIAKQELFDSNFKACYYHILGAFPVNRENPSAELMKKCIKILKNGEGLVIFGQGGRREDVEIGDSKAGMVLFAIKAQVPIIPSAIVRTKKGIVYKVSNPVYFEEYYTKRYKTEDLEKEAEKIMTEIKRLVDEECQ